MDSLITVKVQAILNAISKTDDFDRLNESERQQYYTYLNEYAENRNIVLMLINKTTLEYESVSPNFNQFWDLHPMEKITSFKAIYPKVLEDVHVLEECLNVHEKLMENFSASENMYFSSTLYGAKATTMSGRPIRLAWHIVPLVLNGHRQSKILLCHQKNVLHLMEGNKYWFRIMTDENVYTWFSDKRKIRNKEIVSKTELACIRNWALGMKVREIAMLQNISSHTVNNHLKAARKRVGARNNTALVEICDLLGI